MRDHLAPSPKFPLGSLPVAGRRQQLPLSLLTRSRFLLARQFRPPPFARFNPSPTLFEPARPASPTRGQWDSALKATPHSPKALEPTARSGAHGFRSRHPRSLSTVLTYYRVRVNTSA